MQVKRVPTPGALRTLGHLIAQDTSQREQNGRFPASAAWRVQGCWELTSMIVHGLKVKAGRS